MYYKSTPHRFTQAAIDRARLASRDPNLVHDPQCWQSVSGNPFGGPIVLGFQMVGLVEQALRRCRAEQGEDIFVRDHRLSCSHYQLNFLKAVRPDEPVTVEIKDTRYTDTPDLQLNNRVLLRADDHLALMGHKREAFGPLLLEDYDFTEVDELDTAASGTYLRCCNHFLVRRVLRLSAARQFTAGCGEPLTASDLNLGPSAPGFSEVYPLALISGALVRKAANDGWNLRSTPLVYKSHELCIDRDKLAAVEDGCRLALLVTQRVIDGVSERRPAGIDYENLCFGVLPDRSILFRARLIVSALASTLKPLAMAVPAKVDLAEV